MKFTRKSATLCRSGSRDKAFQGPCRHATDFFIRHVPSDLVSRLEGDAEGWNPDVRSRVLDAIAHRGDALRCYVAAKSGVVRSTGLRRTAEDAASPKVAEPLSISPSEELLAIAREVVGAELPTLRGIPRKLWGPHLMIAARKELERRRAEEIATTVSQHAALRADVAGPAGKESERSA